MFPVKKTEENKFILTAPTEFIPPSLSHFCCVYPSLQWLRAITAVSVTDSTVLGVRRCSGLSAEEGLAPAGIAASHLSSPHRIPSLSSFLHHSCLVPAIPGSACGGPFVAYTHTWAEQMAGEEVMLRSHVTGSAGSGTHLILAAPLLPCPQDSQQLQELHVSKTSLKLS